MYASKASVLAVDLGRLHLGRGLRVIPPRHNVRAREDLLCRARAFMPGRRATAFGVATLVSHPLHSSFSSFSTRARTRSTAGFLIWTPKYSGLLVSEAPTGEASETSPVGNPDEKPPR